jgi:acetate kinase
LLNWLDEGGCHNVPRLSDLDAVGHCVVHGADRFTESIFIDAEVISGIEALEDLAPLHNAPAVDVIHASRDVLATAIPMFAVFDTAFHCRLPPQASNLSTAV